MKLQKMNMMQYENLIKPNDGKYPDWYIGAVGFLASYNGKFFGGRAGIVKTKLVQYVIITMKQSVIFYRNFLS